MRETLPTHFDVFLEVSRDIATRLLYLIHDVGLVHHIPLAEGNKLLELIGEKFPTNIESSIIMNDFQGGSALNGPFHRFPNHLAVNDRNSMCETETGVHDQYTFRRRQFWLRKKIPVRYH